MKNLDYIFLRKSFYQLSVGIMSGSMFLAALNASYVANYCANIGRFSLFLIWILSCFIWTKNEIRSKNLFYDIPMVLLSWTVISSIVGVVNTDVYFFVGTISAITTLILKK